ncbi:MAG: hypothetical protein H7829_08090 [Magnetococcus sp. THC-1_WYH]
MAESLSGILWPPFKRSVPHRPQAYVEILEQTQWLSPDEIQEKQASQLRRLLKHAHATVPFYRKIMEEAGFNPEKIKQSADLRPLPLLKRGTLQTVGMQLQSTKPPQDHGPAQEHTTSGSVSMPVKVMKQRFMGHLWDAITIREHLWHGRDFSQGLVAIRNLKKSPFSHPHRHLLPNWGSPVNPMIKTGPSTLLSINVPVDQQLAWLQSIPFRYYLATYPSNLHALLVTSQGVNPALPGILGVRTLSETLDDQTRALCHTLWGHAIQDIYSCEEVGYMAIQCPNGSGYHTQDETILVEILDDQDQPTPPGQVGRVVVTPLHGFGMPLIRYEVGDFAEVGNRCPCGRGLGVIRRILGRVRNLVTMPDGSRFWPSGFDQVGKIKAIKQHRTIQTTAQNVEVQLVVRRPLTVEEEVETKELFKNIIGHHFDVLLTYHDTLARSQSGKFEDFVSLIPAPIR